MRENRSAVPANTLSSITDRAEKNIGLSVADTVSRPGSNTAHRKKRPAKGGRQSKNSRRSSDRRQIFASPFTTDIFSLIMIGHDFTERGTPM